MVVSAIPSNKVNGFNAHYFNSSNNEKYMRGQAEEKEIMEGIEILSYEELVKMYNELSDYARGHYVGKRILELIEAKKPAVVEAQKPKSIRSKIFSTAWAFIKKGIYSNLSEALKAAWAKFKLEAKLSTSVAHFSYRKASGELREAIGTLREGNFDYDYKGAPISNKPDVIKYYNLVSNAWRSFRIERLVS